MDRPDAFFNEMSFEDLLKRISPTLKRITYKLNGHFSFFNDEDLFQEALVYLWLSFKEGKTQDKTDSYILQGCYFHLKNHLRKVRDKVNLVSIDALISEEGINLEEILSVENSAGSLSNDWLTESINKNGFTKREKEVLALCSEGLTTRQIGKRLGISHVAVVKLIGRIRKRVTKNRSFLLV